jgi:hypothetical protein
MGGEGIEGNTVCSTNQWEEVTKGIAKAIEKWIDDNCMEKLVFCILRLENTVGKKWIKHKIKK